MSSTSIVTVTKMMETLPEPAQNQVMEYLRDFIMEIQDDAQWDKMFENTQEQLIVTARRAKKEIAGGLAKPMDYDRL